MRRFKELLASQQPLILDGALGTELEFRGYDISGQLWSAKYLLEDPQAILAIHQDYLKAGADILTTSSYQATPQGLMAQGLSETTSKQLIQESVHLAQLARQTVWEDLSEADKTNRNYPLIAGDVGPYAAFLANASEYTGDYGEITVDELREFHRQRIHWLLEAGVDLLALETVPNQQEVKALIQLLEEAFPTVEAYLSVTTLDGNGLPDGTPLRVIGELVEKSSQVLALGVNCVSPDVVAPALKAFAQTTLKPFVVYPNSGEVYDTTCQAWQKAPAHSKTLLENHQEWQVLGTKVLGGCCRTRPQDIARLTKAINL